MSNLCYNKVIITHDDITKVRDLYRSTACDFFNFILPTPVELWNKDTLRNKQYNPEKFGADNLYDWRIKNWGSGGPVADEIHIRTLSKHGKTLMLAFDTKWKPPIGIYEELQRQGYYVKAYFHSMESCYCGSFIYGVGEWYQGVGYPDDVPLDIYRMFNVKAAEKAYYDDCIINADDMPSDKEDVVEDPALSTQRHTDNTAYFRDIVDEILY